jgi:hypothetical protein
MSTHQRNSTRVTRIDANSDETRPMVRVMAKPLTVPVAHQNSTNAVIKEVKFESKIAVNAFS